MPLCSVNTNDNDNGVKNSWIVLVSFSRMCFNDGGTGKNMGGIDNDAP